MKTAATPKTPAPAQLRTPPDVYALGTYWSIMLRGADKEMTMAAKKKEMYKVVLETMNRMAGKLGLKLGAMAECPGDITLGIGAIGPADWGP
jgi:hypothetical protein